MSIKINQKTIAGKYKAEILPNADTVNTGKIRIATQTEVNEGTDNTTAVTPYYLSTKQDKLTAGENITIENNIIKTNIKPDNNTITQNEDGTFTTIAQKTTNDKIMISWTGTLAEYNEGIENGTIMPEWYCYITDDEQIVDYTSLVTSNEFEENKTNVENQISDLKQNKANIDLDNLTQNGEKHFLNKSQITNCILEAPQNILYELTDGTFTLKAGSKLLVPYGTTDRSAEFPVGSTFLHDNYKVVYTSFIDNKFMVEVEVQEDISQSGSATDSYNRNIGVDIVKNSLWTTMYSGSGTSLEEGTTNISFYNTETNLFIRRNGSEIDSNSTLSFPVGRVLANSVNLYASLTNVFDYIGYIGSVIFVRKGIKTLSSNGKAKDYSLGNQYYTLHEDKVFIVSADWHTTTYLSINSDGTRSVANSYYEQATNPNVKFSFWKDTINNKLYINNNGVMEEKIGTVILVFTKEANPSTIITSLTPYQPVELVKRTDLQYLESNIQGKLDLKADKTDLTKYNKSYVTTTYRNGTSWYRVWSDGWCEQGGVWNYTHSIRYMNTTITLLKKLSVVVSKMATSVDHPSTSTVIANVDVSTTSSSDILSKILISAERLFDTNNSTGGKVYWEVKGYI